MVGKICERGRFEPGVKVRELWMGSETGESTEEELKNW